LGYLDGAAQNWVQMHFGFQSISHFTWRLLFLGGGKVGLAVIERRHQRLHRFVGTI
jgi:hypothetical protein